jgi:hypothetical protein
MSLTNAKAALASTVCRDLTRPLFLLSASNMENNLPIHPSSMPEFDGD